MKGLRIVEIEGDTVRLSNGMDFQIRPSDIRDCGLGVGDYVIVWQGDGAGMEMTVFLPHQWKADICLEPNSGPLPKARVVKSCKQKESADSANPFASVLSY